uniref:Uncharacterized protein n=1 Tax=Timema cristinae TaxID=61476 RepID=A0A7R9HDY6_TIMCR|nr:unnamed protein product [Timema cristinae]
MRSSRRQQSSPAKEPSLFSQATHLQSKLEQELSEKTKLMQLLEQLQNHQQEERPTENSAQEKLISCLAALHDGWEAKSAGQGCYLREWETEEACKLC